MATKPDISTYGDWRTAVTDLIAFYVESGLPFSSGEIVRDIRVANPNLRFSATAVGELVKETFNSGSMPNYMDGYDNPVYPMQVPRVTTGKSRTPAGMQVFVYAVDQQAGDAHDFEVEIPQPGQQVAAAPTPQPPAPPPGFVPSQATPTPSPVIVHGVPSALKDHRASVGSDRRLMITRSTLEALSHATGTPIRATDPVYVAFLPGRVTLALVQPTGHASAPYDLTRTKGSVVLANPGQPFNPGEVFGITVDANGAVVDLSKNLATTR